jgi:hypothetical protein
MSDWTLVVVVLSSGLAQAYVAFWSRSALGFGTQLIRAKFFKMGTSQMTSSKGLKSERVPIRTEIREI